MASSNDMDADATALSSLLFRTMSVIMWRSLQLLLGIGALTLTGLYFKQDSLLYFPEIGNLPRDPARNPRGYRSPSEYQIPYEDIHIMCEDGVSLHAWLMLRGKNDSSSSSTPTVVFFHGNAGNIGIRLPNAVQMFHRLEVNVLLVEYRGYGRSDKVTPNERGLKLDGRAVLQYVQNHPDMDPSNLFLFGRSLGGAVAFATAQYAQENCNGEGANNIHPLKGIIVENTFTSIPDMVDHLMPPIAKFKSFILAIQWNSMVIVPTLTCPVFYLAGSIDEIVPHSQMLKLHKLTTRSVLNRLHVIDRGTHNESWSQGGKMYWDAFQSFLAGAISISNDEYNDLRNPIHSEVADESKKEL
mmetsp:Transcript_8907/g.21783  ORF Transcript_8907/g.21783 Transcript_8907/m.21783 type:complete len:356 (-) Transcript_8907:7-1074(-)